MAHVKILDGDDWVQVWVDEELVYEGHNVSISHDQSGVKILEAIGADVDVQFGEFCDGCKAFRDYDSPLCDCEDFGGYDD